MLTLTDKKKLPVTTLLRAIGFENDKDILEIFNLAEEVKVTKTNLKKYLGQKLAARVLKSWVEDFVDEDTGEVVSIERNEVILDRETILEEEHINDILESGVPSILIHKEDVNTSDYPLYSIRFRKTPVILRRKPCSTFTGSYVMRILRMMPVRARLSIIYFSRKNVMIWEKWGATVSTRS